MDILRIAVIGIVAAVMALLIRRERPDMAMQIGIGAGIIIFVMVAGRLAGVIDYIQDIAKQHGIRYEYIEAVIKIIGIAYIAEFATEACRDSGEGAIAAKIEFGGKVFIAAMAAPIMVSLIELIVQIVP